MTRNILEDPRVTRFKIDWGGDNVEPEANNMEGAEETMAEEDYGNSLMEPPLKTSFNIHTESSHSTMEVVWTATYCSETKEPIHSFPTPS